MRVRSKVEAESQVVCLGQGRESGLGLGVGSRFRGRVSELEVGSQVEVGRRIAEVRVRSQELVIETRIEEGSWCVRLKGCFEKCFPYFMKESHFLENIFQNN